MVTRAASGIGAGIAARFLGMGDRVIALDKDENGLASLARELASANLLLSIADVTDGVQMEKVLGDAVTRFGHPEVLVNNAGTTGGPQATTLHETPPEVVDCVLDVNLRAVIQRSAAVLPGMLERGRGVIVNIASVTRVGCLPSQGRLLHQQSCRQPDHSGHCCRLRPLGDTLCFPVPGNDRHNDDPLAARQTWIAGRGIGPHSAEDDWHGV
jgi:NAD(P)-dependent dehydrogenase (short-subunit alcohol dehydrogenase family)